MVNYLIRRLLAAVFVLWGVSILIFTLLKITPGDAVKSQLPQTATQDQLEAMRHALGLDRPLPRQYLIWLENALQGDLG